MLHSRLLSTFCLVVGFATPVLAQQAGGTSNPQDPLQRVKESAQKWVDAYNAGDAAKVAGLLAEDAIVVSPSGTILRGRPEIEAGIANRMKAGWTRQSLTPLEAYESGDITWVIGEYTLYGSGPNDGKKIEGRYANVIVRREDRWVGKMTISNINPTQDILQYRATSDSFADKAAK